MTFINQSSENTLQYNTPNTAFIDKEESEVSLFNRIILFASLLLLLISSFFIYNAFFQNETIKSNHEVLFSGSSSEEPNKVVENSVLPVNSFKNEVISPKEALLNLLEQKDVFQISSANQDGFYVMVGTFSNYKNAMKLQKMNPTEYTCHIFEPNYKNLNRVGLFIDDLNLRKAENALIEIRNMQPKSWLLYNTMH